MAACSARVGTIVIRNRMSSVTLTTEVYLPSSWLTATMAAAGARLTKQEKRVKLLNEPSRTVFCGVV
jgi:hypothetical protein